MKEEEVKSNQKPLTNEQLQSIYESYADWIGDVDKNGMPEEDWWAGHGYGGYLFDINFCIPYERDDDTDTNDFGVWLYSVSDDGQTISSSATDVTAQFKAYLAEKEFCTICKVEIMYESPDNFDPVCVEKDDNSHHEECCTCMDYQITYKITSAFVTNIEAESQEEAIKQFRGWKSHEILEDLMKPFAIETIEHEEIAIIEVKGGE